MRRSISLAVLAAAAAGAPSALHGQNFFTNAGWDIRNGVSDAIYVWKAPLRADRKDWLTAGGVIAFAAVSSLADDDVDAWFAEQDEKGNFDWFEFFRERENPDDIEWSDIGAARWLSKGALAMWIVGLATDSEGLRDAGMGCLATWASIVGTREVNYQMFKRRRPSDANGNQYLTEWGHGEWVDRSFITGHFANPMGCTKFWTDRFELGALEPAMYATSYAIAISRSMDRRHWLSDSILAGALGYAAGKIVARRQEQRREREPNR